MVDMRQLQLIQHLVQAQRSFIKRRGALGWGYPYPKPIPYSPSEGRHLISSRTGRKMHDQQTCDIGNHNSHDRSELVCSAEKSEMVPEGDFGVMACGKASALHTCKSTYTLLY